MKNPLTLGVLWAGILWATLVYSQDNPPLNWDQAKVDQAVKAGVTHLKSRNESFPKPLNSHPNRTTELVLLTYIHAGVPESDPEFQFLLKEMLEGTLETTYCVALQAMALEELDRAKYQGRLRQCAQFLVDNHCVNGQWSYGTPTTFVEDVPTRGERKEVASGARDFGTPPPAGAGGGKPKVKAKLRVEKKRDGPATGDNSNTQYAALGMRACHDAGIQIPASVTELAMKWYRESQKQEAGAVPEKIIDRGSAPAGGPQKGTTVASRAAVLAEPQGWDYGKYSKPAYGSMTAGAIGGLAIWDYIRDNDEGKAKSWKKDANIHKGLAWMAKNFSVTYNPGLVEGNKLYYYYYLYGLERAGMLYGTEYMGSHEWYPEGVKVLLEAQRKDGAWGSPADTCFAILFLRRSTRPLDVASEDRFHKR